MPPPTMRWLSSSKTSLVKPLGARQADGATRGRPRNLPTPTFQALWPSPRFRVTPTRAIPDRYRRPTGITRATHSFFSPAATSATELALVRGLVRQHRLADQVADGEDVRHVAAHLRIDVDEAAFATRTPAFSASSLPPFGARPTDTSTRSNTLDSGMLSPSNVQAMPAFCALASTTFVFRWMHGHALASAGPPAA